MAPPDKRRSSTSRRAQYGLFTGYVLAALGVLLGALLLAISLWRPSTFSGPRGAAQTMVAPATAPTTAVRTESQSVLETLAGFWRAGSQNAALRKEMELARIRLAEAASVKQENARLKRLLGLAQADTGAAITTTQFIGSTASSARRFGYIAAGTGQGVRAGMPVRSARGVVGRVMETGRSSSRVLLLSDTQSVLPVRLAREDVVAFAEGRGDGFLRIRLINLGINPVRKGDLFVTSGTGGYFAPGMAVAVATEITSDGALARMVSDPAATDYVAVMPLWQTELVRVAETPVEQAVTE
ncbi:rod shape-determining protein MreC [Altererythrobacter sp. H2]|uniref:rod shape-determining protein MreC n=1 Tax=Altererythrobacter sp. H2 TaxID=3108391 RepID=UPI000BC7F748|nr:rod shape-determining protein MreC [Altererythrobacter sp. H2]OZA91603.1 MAG: rod shape-determining protein MreC [Erythrobacter sp. 34-65-8]WRK94435.1 rod shape-determining protein MreC [Altererythrobacter sp. H2]